MGVGWLSIYYSVWDEIWHKHMGRVDVGFYIIKIRIRRFFGISIYLFLFVLNYWDLENYRSDGMNLA